MVRQYYVPQITELSEEELQSVFGVAEPPVCLLGGWAVHLQVNQGFSREHGRGYIGSRDIDLGIHVEPDWTAKEYADNGVGKTLAGIEELGYTKSRFGFVQNFHRETSERISESEAREYVMHEVFQVYIDVIPDTTELDNFRDRFGFTPPAETLLKPVFERGEGVPLSEYVSWSAPDNVFIVAPELLAAMKIRSLPDRDKSHKRVKDAADLHALLWYTKDYQEMKEGVQQYVTDDDMNQLQAAINEELFENAAQLLQIDPIPVSGSIRRLFQ
ncbi:nucleotidyl transferase AbiEii/AbiGii toxin family protein [Natrialbaceae archaeon A-CW2]